MLPRVHIITDLPRTPVDLLEDFVAGGVDAIQIRAKDLGDRELFDFTRKVVEVVAGRAAVIVNDRIDVALAAGADGVHLGREDLPVAAARRLAPAGFLIGGTVRSPDQARAALAAGADYVGAGPVYPSTTKGGLPEPLGLEVLADIARIVPTIAISGITTDLIASVMSTGAHGVAVVAAVSRASDPGATAREIVAAVRAAVAVR